MFVFLIGSEACHAMHHHKDTLTWCDKTLRVSTDSGYLDNGHWDSDSPVKRDTGHP